MSVSVGERGSAEPRGERQAPLLVCMFHMNLAFSSLDEERQPEVIERCYRPMLALAERTPFPIAIEATGYTLERIAAIDPRWIDEAKRLLAAGRLELVGSGYAQCAAPLLPAEVNRWNLRIGLDVYEELLGMRPRAALISEQAYSPGLVPLYLDAGYEAILVDWDNAFRSYPDWDPALRRFPQRAAGGGASIPVVWSESIAFQKFQRFAHDEMSLEEYLEFVRGAAGDRGGALLLYANDAEIFDHRPGRFKAEPKAREGEWDRIAEGLAALADRVGSPSLVSGVLGLLDRPEAGHELHLEAPAQPVPTKKQNKYNPSRWAVTGRDDVGVNTRCQRIYERLSAAGETDPAAWRELCALWASDFRTHITDSRWERFQAGLAAAESRFGVQPPAPPRRIPAGAGLPEGVAREGRMLTLRGGDVEAVLNVRRGLAVESFRDARVGADSLFGTIEHGYFPTIELGADWYTGNLVQEAPLRHKVTDLEHIEPTVERDGGLIVVGGTLETDLGPLEKTVTLDCEAGAVEIEWTLRWPELPHGSLRLAHVSLNPEAFDERTLWFATHNGGPELERHEVDGVPAFDHGAPVSAQVSCNQGLGVTEGVLLLGDAGRTVRIEIDRQVAAPMGLVGHQSLPAGHYFFRAALSLTESDETRRGPIPRPPGDPQRTRIRLSATA